ncbi:MAG: iron-containing alcohol dehydrogenase [Myxococcales bacterium]
MTGTFRYENPDTIHFGPGSVRESLIAELDRIGARRAFLVTTASAGKGAGRAVGELLGERLAGRYDKITQHSPAGAVMEAATAAREARADVFVSVGGGSPIDASKAAAFAIATGLDLRDPASVSKARGMKPKNVLPHFAVPTTLSVAELSGSAGFSAESTKEKVGVAARELRPTAVFYDGVLATDTPIDLWSSTGIRAVDHAVETIFADGEHPIPDATATESLRGMPQALVASKSDPRSADARSEGQIAAWLSYLLPGPAARGLSHTLGKRIGSRHEIPHGVTSCLLLPHVIRFLGPRKPQAMERLRSALGADPAGAIDDLVSRLGLPQHLSEWNLTEKDLQEAVAPLAGKPFSAEELLGILRAAL